MLCLRPLLCLLEFVVTAASLTPQESVRLLSHLDQATKPLLKTLEGVSDASWNYRACPERWSIAECAEQVVIAEVKADLDYPKK